MQIVPQILSCFGISNTRLLALQCSNAVKKLINPIIETEYSLFFKGTFSMSTKSPLRAENSTFFWQGHGQKSTAENAPKHAIPSEKFIFFLWMGHSSFPIPLFRWKDVPTPHTILLAPPSLLHPPCVPQNSSQIYAIAGVDIAGVDNEGG